MTRRQQPAEHRLRRLLVMLPWLMERESVALAEVAAHFGCEPDEVARDLELASMCGLPPYVDELIDVFIDEGMVHVGVPRLFTRPLRLDATEAFELLAAARTAMELPGADPDGPLARGLTKLAAATGRADDPAVTVELERPAGADDFAAAVEAGQSLDLEYWSAARDEVTTRRVLPLQVFVDRGNWYLTAHDERTASIRTFRLDRIVSATPTDELVVAGPGPVPSPGDWFADGGVARVTLRVGPASRWIIERYPVDRVEELEDGWTRVVLPVASDRWIERLLLRLGSDAVVEDPSRMDRLGADAAARLLAIYDRGVAGTAT